MTATQNTAQSSFIVLQIGSQRFALSADAVVELSAPVRLHTFPHTSPAVIGVIVRRRRIVPVYDAAPLLAGRSFSHHRFYVVARRRIGEASELGAMPVSGECELASGEMQPPTDGSPAYVRGVLPVGEESVPVLDFNTLVNAHVSPEPGTAGEEGAS